MTHLKKIPYGVGGKSDRLGRVGTHSLVTFAVNVDCHRYSLQRQVSVQNDSKESSANLDGCRIASVLLSKIYTPRYLSNKSNARADQG